MLDRNASHISSYDFDHALFSRMQITGTPQFNIYPFPFQAVVIGRGSRSDQEIRMSRCLADNIPVYRRRGGGCAVFLDPGNLIVSLALPAKGFPEIPKLFNQCNQWLIKGLAGSGISGIYQDGTSDLVIENQKVGGTCLHCTRELTFYTASLMVDPNVAAIMHYLQHPPREPEYRNGRLHQNFVTSLSCYVKGLTPDLLAKKLGPLLHFT